MIYVHQMGRLGNNLFQYAFARIVAKENNMVVGTPFVQNDIISVKDSVSIPMVGSIYRIEEVLEDPMWTLPQINSNSSYYNGMSYFLYGYFQRWYLYENNIDFVKSIFTYDDVAVDNYDDVVLHVRLTDYNNNCLKPASVYFSVLDGLKFGKLYIVTDDPNDPYLNAFKQKYDCVVVSESPRHDFYFMMRFNTIITANSTFSWWSAFFSKAQNKYVPKDYGFYNAVDLYKMGIGY